MKTYKVSGPFSYQGHLPGSTFQAKASDVVNALSRGSITEVAAPSESADTPAKRSRNAEPNTKEK